MGTSFYTIVCSTMHHLIRQEEDVKDVGRTPIQTRMMMTATQLRNEASAVSCTKDEFGRRQSI
jgi:hypothetical protein